MNAQEMMHIDRHVIRIR